MISEEQTPLHTETLPDLELQKKYAERNSSELRWLESKIDYWQSLYTKFQVEHYLEFIEQLKERLVTVRERLHNATKQITRVENTNG